MPAPRNGHAVNIARLPRGDGPITLTRSVYPLRSDQPQHVPTEENSRGPDPYEVIIPGGAPVVHTWKDYNATDVPFQLPRQILSLSNKNLLSLVNLPSFSQASIAREGYLLWFWISIYAHSNSDISPRGSVSIREIWYAELPRNLWLESFLSVLLLNKIFWMDLHLKFLLEQSSFGSFLHLKIAFAGTQLSDKGDVCSK